MRRVWIWHCIVCTNSSSSSQKSPDVGHIHASQPSAAPMDFSSPSTSLTGRYVDEKRPRERASAKQQEAGSRGVT